MEIITVTSWGGRIDYYQKVNDLIQAVDILEGEEKGMKAATTKPEINMVLGKLSYWNAMGMVKRQDWHLS